MARKAVPCMNLRGSIIPDEQMDLPVSFDVVGNLVTLREVLGANRPSILSLASLSLEKRAELTAKRIAAQPKFEVAMIGGGLVDKERALNEVRAHTNTGKVLIEIEQRLIQNLLETAASK